jgi:hypothetical protein
VLDPEPEPEPAPDDPLEDDCDPEEAPDDVPLLPAPEEDEEPAPLLPFDASSPPPVASPPPLLLLHPTAEASVIATTGASTLQAETIRIASSAWRAVPPPRSCRWTMRTSAERRQPKCTSRACLAVLIDRSQRD